MWPCPREGGDVTCFHEYSTFWINNYFPYRKIFHRKFFSPRDWKAAWIFGVMASLVLYPSALGLTHIDTYGWGWAFQENVAFVLFVTSAVLIAIFLLWKKNKFGVLLLLAFVAFVLQLKSSANFWDYFIDPIYGAFSFIMVAKKSFFVNESYASGRKLFRRH